MNNDPNVVAVHTYLMLQSQRRVKREQFNMKATVAAAKAAGVSWRDVQDALKEYEMSPDARREKAERQASVLQALGAAVQLEMFEAYVPRDNDETAQCRRRGWFAGICGYETINCPHDPGTAEGQAWLNGLNDFHAALQGYLGSLDGDALEEVADEQPA